MKVIVLLVALSLLLTGCISGRKSGGYFENDGPHKSVPVDVSGIPDAVPKWEPVDPSRSRPYTVLGRKYYPLTDARNYRQRGVASWYGRQFHGRRTALGEKYDMYAMTAAHTTLPLPSYVQVRNLANNKTVVVRVNDRGPFLHKRLIDLSYAAAYKLDMLKTGTANVEVVAISPGSRPAPVTADAGVGVEINPMAVAANEPITGEPLPEALPTAETTATPTPVSVSPTAVTTTSASKEIYVQVGAFGAMANAENLRSQLEQADFRPVLILPLQTAGQKLFRVRIGPLDNAADGETLTRRLAEFGITGSRIVSD